MSSASQPTPAPEMIGRAVGEEIQDAEQAAGECGTMSLVRDSSASYLRVVQGRVHLQYLNSTSFAAGLSCRTAVVVTVSPGGVVNWNVSNAEAGPILVVAGACIAGLTVVIVCVLKACSSTRRALADAEQCGNYQSAARYRAQLMTWDTILNWGLSFAVAAQLSLALDALIPDDPSYWRIVSFCALFATVCVLAASIALCFGPEDETEAKDSLAIQVVTTIVSGSVYVCALEFLSMTTAVFRLEAYHAADDLGPLAVYAAVVGVVASAIIAAFAVKDHEDAVSTSHLIAAGDGAKRDRGGCCCGGWVLVSRRLVRSLIPRIASMSAVCSVYSVLYLALAKRIDPEATLTSALNTREVAILVGMCLAFSLIVVVVVNYLLQDAALRVTAVDRETIPGKFDDAALALIQTLLQTTGSAMVEAASWVLGCSLFALGLSIWSGWAGGEPAEGVLAAWTCALLFTGLAIGSMILAPIPRGAGAGGPFPNPRASE